MSQQRDNHNARPQDRAIVPVDDESPPPETRQFDHEARDPHAGTPVLPGRVDERKLHLVIRETNAVLEVDAALKQIIGRRGRNREVDIDLTEFYAMELGISRHHITFEANGERIMVKDLGSANGTRLNGESLRPNHAYELQHGDELKLGRMHIKVYFRWLE